MSDSNLAANCGAPRTQCQRGICTKVSSSAFTFSRHIRGVAFRSRLLHSRGKATRVHQRCDVRGTRGRSSEGRRATKRPRSIRAPIADGPGDARQWRCRSCADNSDSALHAVTGGCACELLPNAACAMNPAPTHLPALPAPPAPMTRASATNARVQENRGAFPAQTRDTWRTPQAARRARVLETPVRLRDSIGGSLRRNSVSRSAVPGNPPGRGPNRVRLSNRYASVGLSAPTGIWPEKSRCAAGASRKEEQRRTFSRQCVLRATRSYLFRANNRIAAANPPSSFVPVRR